MDTFGLNDHCIVPWKDGSMYAGRVQKILDPARDVVVQTVSHKRSGKIVNVEESTPLARFAKDRHARVSAEAIEESRASGHSWYFVHYSGWKQSFDEWIPEERMLAYTPRHIAEMKRVNAELKELERQARLEREAAEKERGHKKSKKQQKHSAAQIKREPASSDHATSAADSKAASASRPASKRGRQGTPVENSLPVGATKRRRVGIDDSSAPELKINVPLDLKRILVRDWELVTHSRRVVQLPRAVCVVEIIEAFTAAHRDPIATGPNENLEQFAESIITYFDYALGMMLLYRFERNQYYAERHACKQGFRPSLVYGAEHLARLIVSMPALLAQMPGMDDKTTEYVTQTVSLLAKYITDNRRQLFAGEKSYDSVTRVYEAFAVPDMQGDMQGDNHAGEDDDAEAAEAVSTEAGTAEPESPEPAA